MTDIFVLPTEQYRPSINPVKNYLNQLAFYISTKRKMSIEQATSIAKSMMKDNFRDKNVKHFHRQENGDRKIENTSLLTYINNSISDENILAPTFTSYVNTKVKKSMISEFIGANVTVRGIAKKEAAKHKVAGNTELFIAKDNEQSNMKLYNNSLSGAFAQIACVLHNPTAHSTLTSLTRTMSSLANANNEKLISGNRYYPRGIDILNDVTYIASHTNIEDMKATIDKYNLYIPTVEDTVNVLKYSSDLYFVDMSYYNKYVIPFLNNLSPYCLAAICYIGDLYHIRKFNDNFMRNLLTDIVTVVNSDDTSDDVLVKLKTIDENILNLVHQIFFSKVKGLGTNYKEMHKKGLAASILQTSINVYNVLDKNRSFFKSFFLTDILPTNVNKIRYMRRRTVVLSDTDSTCFTLDDWVKWYADEFILNDKTIAIGCAVSFMATQTIIHLLAMLSTTLRIDRKELHTLSMKNEFLWTVHMPVEVSKHYAAYTVMKEGNVYETPELEVKGVNLKSSAVPKALIDDSKALLMNIFESISNNKKIKLLGIIDKIKGIEKDITDSVYKGESIFLRKSKIKDKEGYSLPEHLSPYQRHTLWLDVFSSKYGTIDNPPYNVIKIPTIVVSKTSLKEWIAGIEDEGLRERLTTWIVKYNKPCLPTIYLNETYVLGHGIPKEILSIVDIKRIILDTTIQHRMILQSLGVMLMDELTIMEQY